MSEKQTGGSEDLFRFKHVFAQESLSELQNSVQSLTSRTSENKSHTGTLTAKIRKVGEQLYEYRCSVTENNPSFENLTVSEQQTSEQSLNSISSESKYNSASTGTLRAKIIKVGPQLYEYKWNGTEHFATEAKSPALLSEQRTSVQLLNSSSSEYKTNSALSLKQTLQESPILRQGPLLDQPASVQSKNSPSEKRYDAFYFEPRRSEKRFDRTLQNSPILPQGPFWEELISVPSPISNLAESTCSSLWSEIVESIEQYAFEDALQDSELLLKGPEATPVLGDVAVSNKSGQYIDLTPGFNYWPIFPTVQEIESDFNCECPTQTTCQKKSSGSYSEHVDDYVFMTPQNHKEKLPGALRDESKECSDIMQSNNNIPTIAALSEPGTSSQYGSLIPRESQKQTIGINEKDVYESSSITEACDKVISYLMKENKNCSDLIHTTPDVPETNKANEYRSKIQMDCQKPVFASDSKPLYHDALETEDISMEMCTTELFSTLGNENNENIIETTSVNDTSPIRTAFESETTCEYGPTIELQFQELSCESRENNEEYGIETTVEKNRSPILTVSEFEMSSEIACTTQIECASKHLEDSAKSTGENLQEEREEKSLSDHQQAKKGKKQQRSRNHDVKQPCPRTCKKMCTFKIDENQRIRINQTFWNSGRRNGFIVSGCKKKHPLRERKPCKIIRRQYNTFRFSLPDANGVEHEVCKTFMLTTLGYNRNNFNAISIRRVRELRNLN